MTAWLHDFLILVSLTCSAFRAYSWGLAGAHKKKPQPRVGWGLNFGGTLARRSGPKFIRLLDGVIWRLCDNEGYENDGLILRFFQAPVNRKP
ncbi:hypothetical protein [Paraburkholderia hayleyella]|uniref:hypothetical protein n=1 Tax=Paraburkholderia hayleyella TaxID=2152889 RepID=UPI001290E9A8|nr:hypothetical protein [Paraburkholderia hayleyella]